MEMYSRYPNDSDTFNMMYRDHFQQSFHALLFCKNNLKDCYQDQINQNKVTLGPSDVNKKKTIVFDLDETLIHCNENVDCVSDVTLAITFPSGEAIEAGINVRPYAIEMLKEISKLFEIVIFTASHECYASSVIDHLDPDNKYITKRLYRKHCIMTDDGVHVKDLRIFQDRDIKDIVLVDNAAYSFGYQICNGIPIIPFYDSKNDQELRFLTDYLKQLSNFDDVRDFNRSFFKMMEYTDYETPEQALEMIYGVKISNIFGQSNQNKQ